MAGSEVFRGIEPIAASKSDFNAMDFIARAVAGGMATTTLVQIVAVENAGEVAAVGFVDVHPMIAQLDGLGNATPHGVVHNVPYMRLQGGANAVIIDPQVGDIGIAVFASRDLSVVKATKAEGNPGSRRRFSMADALYIGGVLNGVPTQWVRFSADGIEIKSDAGVTILGNVDVTGTITASGQITGAGIPLSTHKHTGVQTGGGTSAGPIP
jgi:hypothetical protein